VAEAITGQNLTDFSWESMSFGNLESLVVGAAKALVWHGEEEYSICEKLSLDGLEHLPDDLAEILGGHVGTLSLNGLSMLSDKAAEALAQHEGPLSLKGMCLETLTEYARQLLRKHLEN